MPGHFTHIYTARRVAERLTRGDAPDWPGQINLAGNVGGGEQYTPQQLGEFMQKWPKHTAIGAVGPDLFYFSQDYNSPPLGPITDELMLALAVYFFYDYAKINDWEPLLVILEHANATLAALIRFLIKLDKIWQDFKKVWDETIGRFVSAAGELLDDLTGGLISTFSDALSELATALKLLAEEELITFADIFTLFDTCIAKGWEEQSFLWSDMTHYRRTSTLARNLIAQAEDPHGLDGPPDPADVGADGCDDANDRFGQFMAFSMGWITHIGLDTVAHSFVNEQCGGPFRLHPQRHHAIENHIDAWNYRQAGRDGTIEPDDGGATDAFPDLSNSALWYHVQITPDNPCGNERPTEISDDPAEAKEQVDEDGEMPLWMANAMVQAMIKTFGPDSPPQDNPIRVGTQPHIYGGSAFQDAIDEGLLTKLIEDITGHGLDRPLQELLDAIAPAPPFEVPNGFPLPWQVRTVYRFMNAFYKLSFWGGWELAKPRRPDVVITPPPEDIDNLLQPPDFSGVSSGDPIEDICNAIKAFFDWVEHEVEAALKLAGDIIKMLASPASYPLRWALYQLAMMAWDIISKTHEIMAHTGFLIPHGEQTYDDGELKLGSEIDIPLITLGDSADDQFKQALADAIDPLGNLDRNQGVIAGHQVPDPAYPYYAVMKMDGNGQPKGGKLDGQEFRRPWAYPNLSPGPAGALFATPTELYDATQPASEHPPPVTRNPVASPFQAGTTPDQVFFRNGLAPDAGARWQYEHSRSPGQTDALNEQHLVNADGDVGPLGDPIPFSVYLIGQLANDTGYQTQFNLDSDRAYGYLTWDWIRNPKKADKAGLGFVYPSPMVWPHLSDNWAGPGSQMELEYVDKPSVPILLDEFSAASGSRVRTTSRGRRATDAKTSTAGKSTARKATARKRATAVARRGDAKGGGSR